MSRAEEIARNLEQVRARIRQAEIAAGRSPGAVRLVAVSKTMTLDDIASAVAAGQEDFGENYAQELRDKREGAETRGLSLRWHFIGPLQSNKVKYVAGKVTLLHTVDSPALADEIARRAQAAQDCLVQVNLAAEPQKRGVAPRDVGPLLDTLARLPNLRCVGLMLIPPYAEDPEAARPLFAALRQLRDEEAKRPRPHVELRELSMGMSHDLEVAVSEGATMVRVGTAIFGARR